MVSTWISLKMAERSEAKIAKQSLASKTRILDLLTRSFAPRFYRNSSWQLIVHFTRNVFSRLVFSTTMTNYLVVELKQFWNTTEKSETRPGRLRKAPNHVDLYQYSKEQGSKLLEPQRWFETLDRGERERRVVATACFCLILIFFYIFWCGSFSENNYCIFRVRHRAMTVPKARWASCARRCTTRWADCASWKIRRTQFPSYRFISWTFHLEFIIYLRQRSNKCIIPW